MIIDTFENAGQYVCLNPGFKQAFMFLKRSDILSLSEGRHEIDGEQVFAIVYKGMGRNRHEARLETHRTYIDIQAVLQGSDEMGWKPLSTCRQPSGAYDAEKDLAFFEDEPDTMFTVKCGEFAVFFPEDAHMPLAAPAEVHKVIIKVALDAEIN